jgi:hypothetical protein
MGRQAEFAKLWRVHALTVGVILVVLMAATACTSKPISKERMAEQASAENGRSATAQSISNPGIDLNCAYDRLQNPPESCDDLFNTEAADHLQPEADVTPQTIDGFRVQIDGSQQPLHATRSDQESWRGAVANLTGISGMSSTVAIVNHSSAMQREADRGEVNGYSTIHYSIDTARFSPTESHMLLKPGEFEKGDAWVTSTGCPVKLSLDSELHRNDGTLIEKLHYEEAMVKK